MEDIVVFQGLKAFNSENSFMFSCSGNAQATFVEKPQLKIISLQILNNVVNRAFTSFRGGSLEIPLTVPLSIHLDQDFCKKF